MLLSTGLDCEDAKYNCKTEHSESIPIVENVQSPTSGCGDRKVTSGVAPEFESNPADDDVSIPDAQLLEIEIPDPVGPSLSLRQKVSSYPSGFDTTQAGISV